MNSLIGLVLGWLVLTGGFILVMHVKYLRDQGTKITKFWYPTILVWGIVAILLDVAFNYVAGTLMYLEWPRLREPMFTARCRRHVKGAGGWRTTVALFWRRQLNQFDDGHI